MVNITCLGVTITSIILSRGTHSPISYSKRNIGIKKEDIWLIPMTKASTPTKKSKKKKNNVKTQNATKTSISQQLRTDLSYKCESMTKLAVKVMCSKLTITTYIPCHKEHTCQIWKLCRFRLKSYWTCFSFISKVSQWSDQGDMFEIIGNIGKCLSEGKQLNRRTDRRAEGHTEWLL